MLRKKKKRNNSPKLIRERCVLVVHARKFAPLRIQSSPCHCGQVYLTVNTCYSLLIFGVNIELFVYQVCSLNTQQINTMSVYNRGTPTWWLHTGLCKFVQNISTNIWSLGKRTDLKLRKVSSFSSPIIWKFLDFIHWMVFEFFCLLRDSANKELAEFWFFQKIWRRKILFYAIILRLMLIN